MKKELVWKIFKLFSVLLVIDFLLMPITSFVSPDSEGCGDYGFLECVGWFLVLPLIAGFFWIAFWWKTYATVFLDEKEIKKWNKKFPIVASLLIAFGRGPYFSKSNGNFEVLMFLIFCAGIALFFFYQIYYILKSLL